MDEFKYQIRDTEEDKVIAKFLYECDRNDSLKAIRAANKKIAFAFEAVNE